VVTHHLTPRIGHLTLRELTPLHVEQMLGDLEGRMTPKTARNVHVVLRRALGQALRAGLVSRNVASREYVDAPKVPQSDPDALTRAQVRRLLEAASGDRLEALFVLAVATGLRQGELLGLEWQDIDLETGSVRVRQALVRRDGDYHRDAPKTDRSKRTVPIPSPVVEAMRQHRERTIAAGFIPIATGPVFANLDGGALSGSWLTHHFYGLLAKAELPRYPFKILRATFGSRLAEAGVSDLVIARLLGHARTATTKRHYIADRPEDALEAVSRLVG
jgi:integrase